MRGGLAVVPAPICTTRKRLQPPASVEVGGCCNEPARGNEADDDREDVEEHGGWTQPTAERFPSPLPRGTASVVLDQFLVQLAEEFLQGSADR